MSDVSLMSSVAVVPLPDWVLDAARRYVLSACPGDASDILDALGLEAS